VRIDCYLSPLCGSKENLKEHIKRALELEAVEAEVIFSVLKEQEAERLGLRGSPSILINGIDILPGEIPGFS
jgi:hypothetical protein